MVMFALRDERSRNKMEEKLSILKQFLVLMKFDYDASFRKLNEIKNIDSFEYHYQKGYGQSLLVQIAKLKNTIASIECDVL